MFCFQGMKFRKKKQRDQELEMMKIEEFTTKERNFSTV